MLNSVHPQMRKGEVFLLMNGCELTAEDDALEEMTFGVAGGERSKEAVIMFFKQHITH